MNLYDDAVEATRHGVIPVLVAGIDSDGDRVLCLSKFKSTRNCGRYMLSDNAGERAAFALGLVEAARAGLHAHHGVRFR